MSEFQNILKQLLKEGYFQRSCVIKNQHSYRENLHHKLNAYIQQIERLSSEGKLSVFLKENIENIKNIVEILLKSLDLYLSGNAGKAYAEIEKLMKIQILEEAFKFLKVSLDTYSNNSSQNNSLFRVRKSNTVLKNREDLFHIPFEKRHLVNNQRYSIAGVPSLYLGSSLYVCWEEMKKPDLNDLYLSHYKVSNNNNNIPVLDFAFSWETLLHQNLESLFKHDISNKKAEAYLAVWPIVTACSYLAEHPDSRFSVEYVIPNLILQWVSQEQTEFSGIKYLSTKTEQQRNNERGFNFVFPTSSTLQKSGYCQKLKDIFVFSQPVAWQLLNTIENSTVKNTDEKISLSDNLEKELMEHYKVTKFHTMETKLRSFMTLNNLEEEPCHS